MQTATAAVKNLHITNHCHSLYCRERSFANHSEENKLFLMQATSSSVLHQSLHVTPHIVYPLLLTKRNKERRQSCRDAAREPDGPALPGLGIVSLSATLVFLSSPTPLVPSAPSSSVSLSATLFFSLASPGRDAYVVISVTVNWTDWTTQPYLTDWQDSSKFHDNMWVEQRCPMTVSY